MTGMSATSAYDFDLRDVRGQIGARRALEIAAAGGHNLLMMGLPRCGKTMLAMRLPGLLPAEHGDAPCSLRAPHHTASVMSMFGGGEPALPGEVSMADGGVLFLDELPEFPRTVLEVLREPLEHGNVTLRRAGESTTLPARSRLRGRSSTRGNAHIATTDRMPIRDAHGAPTSWLASMETGAREPPPHGRKTRL